MRHPSDIPGGPLGVAKWVVGGTVRVPRRVVAAVRRRTSERLRFWRAGAIARRDARHWRNLVRRSAAGRFRIETLLGQVSTADVAVIVCLWNRPSRIDAILDQLDRQSTGRGIRLMLWNNAPADDLHYRDRIAAFTAGGSLRSVEYVASQDNVGGLARFFLARRAAATGMASREFIMLDDDQDISSSFVDDLLAAGGPARIAGVWAWRYLGRSHWDRVPVEAGDPADYVGTGGCVCDVEIVADASFFTELPRRYSFLEDQWMCARARSRGWTLTKVDTPVEFVLHETNQFPALADLKNEFREYLDTGTRGQQTAR
ncbi:hypothetical protein J2X63_000339 [Agromyces sp. 3263]|uniref:glycosyltransferase family 2 protein n=1 Tax=Agromyces sp. 3263 TaxID=2817750 RepID=UPI0028566E9B|nr:hypothetical protein [Agromyces sp. 3263]MDR6904653.1 hypothetical protein [Agromyces sp. 3263]